MTLGISNTENRKQLEKRQLRHAKKLFELAITLLKSFSHFGRIHKEKKSVKDNITKEGNCPLE
jgi:hypothetical protein